jgi:phytoene dehydrogenase-like protein
LDITCRYFYRDGLVLNAWRNQVRLINECAHPNAYDGAALLRFTDYARAMYQAAAGPFLYHSLSSPLDVSRSFVCYMWQRHDEQDNSNGNKVRRNRLRTVLNALSPATLDQRIREFFYFVGGNTHPSGDVPLVMLSGKIVAEMIARECPTR